MTMTSVLLVNALLAAAQFPTAETKPATRSTLAMAGDRAGSMDEHIEILRRIIAQKLHSGRDYYGGRYLSGSGSQSMLSYVAPSAGLWQGQIADGAAPEGVYLPGYGVVFTLTLPSWTRSGKSSDDRADAKPISDWERAQLELRGEKPPAAPQPSTGPPSIRDILVRVLAENGRNLSLLRDDERLTVVITFRDSGFNLTGAASTPTMGLFSTSQNTTSASPFGAASGVSPHPASVAIPRGAGKHPSSAQDYEMLGDLHLKQEQHRDAMEAYAKALAVYEQEAKSNPSTESDQRLAAILLRQAQVQLAQGQETAAMELLKRARALRDGRQASDAKTKEGSKPRVPTKLIVSATKRQLEQAASGKLSMDELRRAFSIEEE